jgi:serine protease inhibitor ecotin
MFHADFGGTEILQPLEAIFKLPKPNKDQETHILLLTDGAVSNTNEIVNLIAKNASLSTRVHTFGVGNGAD